MNYLYILKCMKKDNIYKSINTHNMRKIHIRGEQHYRTYKTMLFFIQNICFHQVVHVKIDRVVIDMILILNSFCFFFDCVHFQIEQTHLWRFSTLSIIPKKIMHQRILTFLFCFMSIHSVTVGQISKEYLPVNSSSHSKPGLRLYSS